MIHVDESRVLIAYICHGTYIFRRDMSSVNPFEQHLSFYFLAAFNFSTSLKYSVDNQFCLISP
jgi:hypothetical protein